MENNQSTQQDSSQLDSSKERLNHRKSVGAANLNSLVNLIKRSPWLIWSGLWILLLVTSIISILSLTHPLGVEQEPESKPVAVEKPTEPPLQTGRPVLWLVGAAAFTVAVGSLVILKRLNSSVKAPQLRNVSSKRGLTRRQQRKILLQENLSHQTHSEPVADEIKPLKTMPLEASQSLASGAQSRVVPDDVSLSADGNGNNSLNSETEVARLPLTESQSLNSDEKMFAAPGDRFSTPDNNLNAELEPVVTVLPPEESDLLDSADESLAEVMDIRKHRSLSSILHDS